MAKDIALDFEWEQWQDDLLGITENAVFPIHIDKENYQPRTLVDQTLETIDPTPNIHTLFVQFNKNYFWNALLPVHVRWSSRMTACAGICSFRCRNGECVIALSEPLLKLRPRKDLVETLLHEMIHAYLFLTNNNRDRNGHGPEFCKHMQRINKIAGTNITIYHNFHDEVRLYQQHWWQCNGPCKNRGPYFGTVRRSMNRPPGPSDYWYAEHQQSCGGTFIKIREPEAKKAIKSKGNTSTAKPTPIRANNNNKTLDSWLSPPKNSQPNNKPSTLVKLGNSTNNVYGFGTGGPNNSHSNDNKSKKTSPSCTKLGTNINSVYEWGTTGPGGHSNSQGNDKKTNPGSRFHGVGIVGGSNTGKSSLLDKFVKPSKRNMSEIIDCNERQVKKTKSTEIEVINIDDDHECPVCQVKFPIYIINDHLNECLIKDDGITNATSTNAKTKFEGSSNSADVPETVECPLCFKNIRTEFLSEHAEKCIWRSTETTKETPKSSRYKCLICQKIISSDISLEQHLDLCVKITYENSDSSDEESKESPKLIKKEKSPEIKEFPCPICMQLFPENGMNQHLDNCLNIS